MIPQWQASRGSLIVSAALDLSRNQVLHFFSERKNTSETIKLIELIRREYKGYRRVYLSWERCPLAFIGGVVREDRVSEWMGGI